jgi:hypothetical protein
MIPGEGWTASADLDSEGVEIAPHAVKIPVGFLLLVRRGMEYGAIKFSKFWTGETSEDQYAAYVSYYQGDKTGNFTNQNVRTQLGELSRQRPRGFGRLSFSFGNKTDILCGPIKLLWSGRGWVYFFSSSQDEGDYGIQLAPTKWTDVSHMNVFSSGLKWYGYDPKRPRESIPISLMFD